MVAKGVTRALCRLKMGGVHRRSRRIALIGLAFGSTWVLAALALDIYGRGRAPLGRYDVIIVCGARVHVGGTPSGSLQRRAERAAELFKRGVAPRIVLTGGAVGDRPSEASVAADLVREAGVPESALLVEDGSTTTKENALFARELLGTRSLRVLVVTDSYHVLRTEWIFERQFSEVSVIGVSNTWWPQGRLALREVAAMTAFVASAAAERIVTRSEK